MSTINENTAKLLDILSTVNSLPTNKIETCTITVNGNGCEGDIIYQSPINGETHYYLYNASVTSDKPSLTLNDVVVGSIVCVTVKNTECNEVTSTGSPRYCTEVNVGSEYQNHFFIIENSSNGTLDLVNRS